LVPVAKALQDKHFDAVSAIRPGSQVLQFEAATQALHCLSVASVGILSPSGQVAAHAVCATLANSVAVVQVAQAVVAAAVPVPVTALIY
jgi:hypothetical protein